MHKFQHSELLNLYKEVSMWCMMAVVTSSQGPAKGKMPERGRENFIWFFYAYHKDNNVITDKFVQAEGELILATL